MTVDWNAAAYDDLSDPAVIEHDDLVGLLNGAEAMGPFGMGANESSSARSASSRRPTRAARSKPA